MAIFEQHFGTSSDESSEHDAVGKGGFLNPPGTMIEQGCPKSQEAEVKSCRLGLGKKERELETAEAIKGALSDAGYEYDPLLDKYMEKALDALLQENQRYSSISSLERAFETQMATILKKDEDFLKSQDKLLEESSGYRHKEQHKIYLAKHLAKPLARLPNVKKEGDGTEYVYLYHGGPARLNELSPAKPEFRKGRDPKKAKGPKKGEAPKEGEAQKEDYHDLEDSSRDGFLSVASTKAGSTPMPGGSCYEIRLSPEEFKKYKFRQYESGKSNYELRTRLPIPVAQEKYDMGTGAIAMESKQPISEPSTRKKPTPK